MRSGRLVSRSVGWERWPLPLAAMVRFGEMPEPWGSWSPQSCAPTLPEQLAERIQPDTSSLSEPAQGSPPPTRTVQSGNSVPVPVLAIRNKIAVKKHAKAETQPRGLLFSSSRRTLCTALPRGQGAAEQLRPREGLVNIVRAACPAGAFFIFHLTGSTEFLGGFRENSELSSKFRELLPRCCSYGDERMPASRKRS